MVKKTAKKSKTYYQKVVDRVGGTFCPTPKQF